MYYARCASYQVLQSKTKTTFLAAAKRHNFYFFQSDYFGQHCSDFTKCPREHKHCLSLIEVQAGYSCRPWLVIGCIMFCSTNFQNMKKLKIQFFLSTNSTSNNELDTRFFVSISLFGVEFVDKKNCIFSIFIFSKFVEQ